MGNNVKQRSSRRMQELFDIAKQRYLEAEGDPRKAINCNEWLTQAEQQEFSELSRRVITDEDIANYRQEHGTLRERYAAMKDLKMPE